MTAGINVYAALSTMLAMLPADSQQIADKLGANRMTVRKWLRQLRAGGVITFGSKVGKWGSRTVHLLSSKPYRVSGRENAETVGRFILAWNAMTSRHTTATLADELGTCTRTACSIVQHMREARLLRIAGWEVHGRTVTPVYDRLDGSDAPRPARIPRSEVNALHWSKRRSVGAAGHFQGLAT